MRKPIARIRRFAVPRRMLLKAAPVVALGSGLAGLGLMTGKAGAERTARGTCRLCTMHCGIIAHARGDRLVRVEGDPAAQSRGFICQHGFALREIVHASQRLRRPLKREGSSFVEISWQQAMEELAARLLQLKERFGPQTLAMMTGWPFVRHPLVHVLHRFTQAFGSPNVITVASLCEAAGRMGKALVAGSNLKPDLRGAKALLVWGANPPVGSPLFGHLVEGMALEGRTLVVVDPIRNDLAKKATLHLRPRPGSDGALALGILHVLFAESLFDAAYVEANTVGLAELRALAEQYPLERVEALTSVSKELVLRAARLLSEKKPFAVWEGLGIEHHQNGVQTVRAVTCIAALCASIDVPGGLELVHRPGARFFEEPLPQLYRLSTPEPVPPPVQALPIGYEEHPLYEVYNRQAQGMRLADAILEDRPYPVRALFTFGANPLTTYPDAARWAKAADKLELLVTVDPFLSETGARSDYVLPASTFAEAGVVGPGEEDAQVARSALVPEQHESWPDWKVVFELARALGLGKYFAFEDFQQLVTAPKVPFMQPAADRLIRPEPQSERPRFPTQSGKLELKSPLLERFNYPGLPQWEPPSTSPSAEYPLWLLTGPRTRGYINSQFRQVPTVVLKHPYPVVRVHPVAAKAAKVAHGQLVEVQSPSGSVRMLLEVTEDVHPEVVLVPAGWSGSQSANHLTGAAPLDPISGFPELRALVCRLKPAT